MYEWDEEKRQTNMDKHGLDFLNVKALFDGRPEVTSKSNYIGEVRFLTTGIIDGNLCTVVWTQRGAAVRFISARRARNAEDREYRKLFG